MSNLQNKNWKNEVIASERRQRARDDKPPTPSASTLPRPEEKGSHFRASDLRGISHLAIAAVEVIIDLVEAFHEKIAGTPPTQGKGGITGFAYRKARASTAMVGHWCDLLLVRQGGTGAGTASSVQREAVIAAVNGLIGDYLSAAKNPLEIPMQFRRDGLPLQLSRQALTAAIPSASGKLLILVHGLCRSDLHWRRNNHDHGAALARDLGYTPLYLHYNSGRHISVNGREFATLLESLVKHWPVAVDEIVIIGHSMGGLVARSACYYGKRAGHAWLPRLKKMISLGTPHQGAPLARSGNWLVATLGRSTITAPFARLGRIRSAGITDLHYGNLVDEDWKGRDRFEHADDFRQHVPLPKGVKCYAIAGTTGRRAGDLRDRLLGDGLIPVDTALGIHPDRARSLAFPPSRQWIAHGIHHLDLLGRLEVYEKIREWLSQGRRHAAGAH